jgi:lipid-A-disaccharide synthase
MGAAPLRIGIVANEVSGDLLGGALARELRALVPGVRLVGVAGACMQEAGCETLFPMERLSVMGLTEVLSHLPELLGLRRRLVRYFAAEPPDCFVGIDAPDFNLGLERSLRERGIPAVHLVSPTVWAWRPGRVKSIRRSVDLMLCLFPFEEAFLRGHGVPARFVGHPLADEIPLQVDGDGAREQLGLAGPGPLIALLPGSRVGEVQRLAGPFVETALLCREARPDLRFVVPLVNPRVRAIFAAELARLAPDLPMTLLDGQSRLAIAAADCVLAASGTATLETLLLKRPMVVGYRVHPLTYWLVKLLGLVKVPHVAMANLLAGRELAPELLQDRCRADLLAPALLALLEDPLRVAEIAAEYARIHAGMRHDSARESARAVLGLIGRLPAGDLGDGDAPPHPAPAAPE